MRLLITLALSGAIVAGSASAQEIPQAKSDWFTDAQAQLLAKIGRTPNTGRAKNVILLIADGNGVGTNYATRLWYGQQMGGFGDEAMLAHETFPYLALAKTYNVNAQTPDSAGTGTAMQTGVKTKAGVLGLDETVVRGECGSGQALASFGDLFAEQGRAVGYVSTARITHATPASGYAKSADRNWENDSDLPEGCGQKDIASQLIERMLSGDVDVAMGGGRRNFFPKADGVADGEGKGGKRTDGVDLIEAATDGGAQFAWDDATFASLDLAKDGPILGLFEASHMKYEHDRTGEPSLAEMTAAAITALSNDPDGFFLQVESGRVDHANHDGNLHRVVTDGVAFAEAVAIAAEMTDPSETLIIVTADHEHALAFNGYCGRGSPITGLCYDIDPAGVKHAPEPLTADDGKPYTVAGYLNGPGAVLIEGAGGYAGARPDLDNETAVDPDYLQQALIPKSSETHSGADVSIYARGPWAHLFDGTVEQNYIFHVMHFAANIGSH